MQVVSASYWSMVESKGFRIFLIAKQSGLSCSKSIRLLSAEADFYGMDKWTETVQIFNSYKKMLSDLYLL